MKQTAIEWLADNIMPMIPFHTLEYRNNFIKFIEQAKAMEKEHIIEAYETAMETDIYNTPLKVGKEYYNETFKSEKHNTDIRSMDKLIESNKKFDENNLKGFKYDPNDRSEDTPDITNFFY